MKTGRRRGVSSRRELWSSAAIVVLLLLGVFSQALPSSQVYATEPDPIDVGLTDPLAKINATYARGDSWSLEYVDGKYVKTYNLPLWIFDGSSFQPYIYQDNYTTLGFHQIKNGLIGVRLYDYYAVFYDPQIEEVRVYDERWEVQEWRPQGQGSWSDLGAQSGSPSWQVSGNSTTMVISKSFTSWAGVLVLDYIFREGQPLKHTITFTSSLEESTTFRVIQAWAGIVGDRVAHVGGTSIISAETVIESPIFTFLKTDDSLSVREDQSAMFYLRNETTGQIQIKTSQNIKPVSVDLHAQGLKANFIFSNWTLAPGEILTIDPDTSTYDYNDDVNNDAYYYELEYQGSEPSPIAADATGDGELADYTLIDSLDTDRWASQGSFGTDNWAIGQQNFHFLIDEDAATISQIDIIINIARDYWKQTNRVEKIEIKTDSGYALITDTISAITTYTNYSLQISSNFADYLDGSNKLFIRAYNSAQGQGAGGAGLYTDWIQITVTFSLNNAPTLTSASNLDMKDSDNIYGGDGYSTFRLISEDTDGATDISGAYLRGMNEAGVLWEVRGTNLDSSPSWSIQSGADVIDLDSGSCSWSVDGNTGTADFEVRLEGDHVNVENLELSGYVIDSASASAGWTELASDYWDAINRLVTINVVATDGNINLGGTGEISGDVRYSTTAAGDTPSSYYPADALYTDVAIHNSAHAEQGTDITIVNGHFDISFTIPSAVQLNTYHIYIDMDPDWSDGDAPDVDTAGIIGNRVNFKIGTLEVADAHINSDTTGLFYVELQFEYEETEVTTGQVDLNTGSMGFDGGDHRFEYTIAPGTVTDIVRNIVSISGNLYGITALNSAVTSDSETIEFDEVVYQTGTLETSDDRINFDATGEWYGQFMLDNNDEVIVSGTFNLNTGTMAYDGDQTRWEYTYSPGVVMSVARNIVSVSGLTGDITKLSSAITGDSESIIFDRDNVTSFWASDYTPEWNETFTLYAIFESEYDSHAGDGSDTLTIEGVIYDYDVGNSRHYTELNKSTLGNYYFDTLDGLSEATYEITSALFLYNLSITVVNTAPTAPTINNPANNTDIEPSTTLDVDWSFNDVYENDSQSAYQIQYSDSDNFTDPLYDSAKTVSSLESQEVTFPQEIGDYFIRFKTWDTLDSESPWTNLLAIEVAHATTGSGWTPGSTSVTDPEPTPVAETGSTYTPTPDYTGLGLGLVTMATAFGLLFKPMNNRKNDVVKDFRNRRNNNNMSRPPTKSKNEKDVKDFKNRRKKR